MRLARLRAVDAQAQILIALHASIRREQKRDSVRLITCLMPPTGILCLRGLQDRQTRKRDGLGLIPICVKYTHSGPRDQNDAPGARRCRFARRFAGTSNRAATRQAGQNRTKTRPSSNSAASAGLHGVRHRPHHFVTHESSHPAI
jgi:hypothetical protein